MRAQTNLLNKRYNTALSMAVKNKHDDIVFLLLENGANPSTLVEGTEPLLCRVLKNREYRYSRWLSSQI